MRGKGLKLILFVFRAGITPAYAGKSLPAFLKKWAKKDHPRVCGEKEARDYPKEEVWGSPPRMRGKVHQGVLYPLFMRITPAYAGKSLSDFHLCSLLRDHPRVCGEKAQPFTCKVSVVGSPPRMRGKGFCNHFCLLLFRITPAYAGKRYYEALARGGSRDHPRVCGEKCTKHISDLSNCGITPAYAGKRLKRSRSTVSPVAIVPLFPSVCNKPVVSDGSPAVRDAPLFLPAENAVPASPACNLRSL